MPDILSRKEFNMLVEALGHQESPGPESAATIAWLAEQARLAAWYLEHEDECALECPLSGVQCVGQCATAAHDILEWWEAGDA